MYFRLASGCTASAGLGQERTVPYFSTAQSEKETKKESSEKKPNITLPGTVEKIIPAIGDEIPEKAEIKVEGADDLYREVRI
jgi:hypothetical protein